jgi:hypothetical protein
LKVIVYVEGDGDRLCLTTLLAPLIETRNAAGIRVQFVPMTRGDRKVALLTNAPVKAAHILMNDQDAWVVILPDLYPPNKAFTHTSCAEMQDGITARFADTLARSGGQRAAERFRVFCLIHDLEVLLLAAEELLMGLCNLTRPEWVKPVEDQNHHTPPKRIVEKLIPRYQPTVDGPRVLASADYRVIAERCPNGFGRFVAFLESVTS